MSIPVPVTFQAIASATGGVPGTATLTLYDYTPELEIIDTEIKALATAFGVMTTELGLISAELLKLQNLLIAVQSPTGDFRTISPEDIANDALVASALASNIPPIVVTPEPTT